QQSVCRAWQLDCKRFITTRGDIVSAGLTDDGTDGVTWIGDETFAIQLPSSANRPTISQRTRATYIPQHCQFEVVASSQQDFDTGSLRRGTKTHLDISKRYRKCSIREPRNIFIQSNLQFYMNRDSHEYTYTDKKNQGAAGGVQGKNGER
ncbi:hypothetical protein CSKR_111307, partial [Clonorchis sinensis]